MTENVQTESEKRFSRKILEEEYKRKYTYVKTGKIALLNKNFVEATTYFLKFLSIVAEIHGASNPFAIKPSMFNGPAKTLERFMLSNVYWELAKIYSMSPKMEVQLQKALNQFSIFTINQPFQVVNSETIRKHLKKAKHLNCRHHFEHCQKSIYVKSKKCFIASAVFGEEHHRTMQFRSFKNDLLNDSRVGVLMIELYYFLSPRLLYHYDRYDNIWTKTMTFLIKIALNLFSNLLATSSGKK